MPRASRLLLAALLLAGCSLGEYQPNACTQASDCRQAFGFGAVCGARGLCEQAAVNPRCQDSYPDDLWRDPQRYRQAVVFGSLMDHGSEAHLTRERAIRLAVKQASAAGLEGRPLALIMCDIRESAALDNLTRTAAAVSSASYLSKTLGVAAIIGPSASTDTEQVWQVARGGATLVISPAATSPALTALEMSSSDEQPGLLWRTAPPDSIQGRVIAEDLLARQVLRALVIREAGPYGEGLAAVFSERYRQGGGNLELVSLPGEAQIADVVAALPADAAGGEPPPEVLFISSQQAWITRFLQAAAASPAFTRRAVFLTDAAANQAVLAGATGAQTLYPRVRGTRPAPRDVSEYVYASFIADYRVEYGGLSPEGATFSAHAFDAAWLTLYGAAWSLLQQGAVTGPGIAGGLRRVSVGDAAPTPIMPASWPGVVAAFRAGRGINVSGASGELDYNAVTRELVSPIEIWTIGPTPEGGSFTLVRVATRTPS